MANYIKESLKQNADIQKTEQIQKKNKQSKKVNKKKHKNIKIDKRRLLIIGGITSSIIALLGAGFFAYSHHEKTKPIGIDTVVKTAQGDVELKESKKIEDVIEVAGGSRLTDRAYQMLWQSQVAKIDNGQDEFSKPEQFRDNMLNLLKTLNSSDANSAAALWTRNKVNYAFTSDDNLTNSGIGHDADIINEYQNLVSGIDYSARRNQDLILADKINNDFKTPWTMAFYAAGIDGAAVYKVVDDKTSSNVLNFQATGIHKFSMRQVDRENANKLATKIKFYTAGEHDHDHENENTQQSSEKVKEVDAPMHAPHVNPTGEDITFNKTAEAFRRDGSANRVYEVLLNNSKRDALVLIVETTSGDLYVYGTYFVDGLQNDEFASYYKNIQKSEDSQPQNWEQFQEQVERYFGN